MKKMIMLVIASGFIFVAKSYAGDINAGKEKSSICAACHGGGANPGISNSESFPNLAGQKKAYLVKQLKAFKSGARVDATMQSMAAGLSDSDIDNLAEYFSSI